MSLALAVLAAPPPATAAVLVMLGGASLATLTVKVSSFRDPGYPFLLSTVDRKTAHARGPKAGRDPFRGDM